MASENMKKVLVGESGGRAYQLLSGKQYLYLIYLGSAERPDGSKILQSPRDYVAERGNRKITKSDIAYVDYASEDEGTRVTLHSNGKEKSFFFEEDLDFETLEACFSGVKIRARGSTDTELKRADIVMSLICVVLMLLFGLCGVLPALRGLGRILPLAWVILPMVWLYQHIRGGLLENLKFGLEWTPLVLSLIFLWIAPTRSDSRLIQLLWSLPTTLVVALVAVLAAKRFDKKIAVIALIALVVYAPSAVLCVNGAATLKKEDIPVMVEDVTNTYRDGNWYYYIAVSEGEVQRFYTISREEYNQAQQGAQAVIRATTGLLGMKSTDVVLTE